MKSRLPVGYVVEVEGVDVTLNLLDMHKGQLAAHAQGISPVTEVGSLLAIESGSKTLVMRVLSLSFAEPKEAHRSGIGSSTHQSEPLRHLTGCIVGRMSRDTDGLKFVPDSLATPALGSEAYPLAPPELSRILGSSDVKAAPIILGEDMRGGGNLVVSLEDLVARHVAVLGSSGQGKSCLTAAVLQQVVQLPRSRVVIFDVNGEYEDAFKDQNLPEGAVKVTKIGGDGEGSYRIPYYALGRYGMSRLLMPSERTQRPALSFALQHLHQVIAYPQGVGLVGENTPYFFDDCRVAGANEAHARLERLRTDNVGTATVWPPMHALCALIAESHALVPDKGGSFKRDSFYYSNVAPLATRVRRFVDDAMFREIVDVDGGAQPGGVLNWANASKALVERLFGGQKEDWRVHIVDLRRVSHDLMPFVLGSVLELYAYELFRRGQAKKVETILVLEEAHHYLRPVGSGEDADQNALAYERLAKEGRKFGLALWLSTQRPSEVSPTVISQCNTWITFRLTSEKDLAAIQSASEWSDRRDIRRIAGLPRQTAMVFGGSVSMPILIHARTAVPKPRSGDGEFDTWAIPYPKPSAADAAADADDPDYEYDNYEDDDLEEGDDDN